MTADQRAFLADLARAAIASATIPAGGSYAGELPPQGGFVDRHNRLGFDLVRPGGRDCYPALWIQDFTMTYSCGLVSPAVGQQHLKCIASRQNGPLERRLASGAAIPKFAVPDHINLDGSAVFFPGTYSAGDDQGGEPYGLRPPANNAFDFIWLAHLRWCEEGRVEGFLRSQMSEVSLLDRLLRAFDSVEHDPASGLVFTTPVRRAVGFIFCDSIYMTGHLLTASLLRRRAALQIAEMLQAAGQDGVAREFVDRARQIASSIAPTFSAPATHGGWLRACTGVSGQPDVWGTLLAICMGVLPAAVEALAVEQFRRDLSQGTIEFEGAIRHVPTDRDASPATAWERTPTAHNTYQNGAYWHTPTGWALTVLRRHDEHAADRLLDRYLAALRRDDFRQGPENNAPWENIGTESRAFQNPVFLTSVTLVLSVLTDSRRAGISP